MRELRDRITSREILHQDAHGGVITKTTREFVDQYMTWKEVEKIVAKDPERRSEYVHEAVMIRLTDQNVFLEAELLENGAIISWPEQKDVRTLVVPCPDNKNVSEGEGSMETFIKFFSLIKEHIESIQRK